MLATFRPEAGTLPLLLCFSHLRWGSVVQRPHHLMRHASRSHRVVFWEEPMEVPPGPDLPFLVTRLTPEGVLVATPWVTPGLDEAARDRQQTSLLDRLLPDLGCSVDLAWYCTPMAFAVAGHLRPVATVYDCMDELSAFQGASLRLALLERRLLHQADLVFTAGRSLHAAKRGLHPQIHLFPSSVDGGHFGQARNSLPAPPDQAHLPQPRIGFHGVIDERMDLDLLAGLADLRPDWHFVMVGPVVKIDGNCLPRRPNIHWLGAKPYQDLPAYLAGWDAGFMPFAMNEATRFISPTKTPEFLAAGVPVVSTPIHDVVHDWGKDGLVEIAADAAHMAEALARVMAQPSQPQSSHSQSSQSQSTQSWRGRVDKRLHWMSWAATWTRMRGRIDENRRARRRPDATGGHQLA